jgi:hypothetical protein
MILISVVTIHLSKFIVSALEGGRFDEITIPVDFVESRPIGATKSIAIPVSIT